jgi:hypothetical protein
MSTQTSDILVCLEATMELADLIDSAHSEPSNTFTNRGFTLQTSASAANRRLKEALTKCGYDPPVPDQDHPDPEDAAACERWLASYDPLDTRGMVSLPLRVLDDVLLDQALSELWYIAYFGLRISFKERAQKLKWAIKTVRRRVKTLKRTRSMNRPTLGDGDKAEAETDVSTQVNAEVPTSKIKRKRSTQKGDAREKLISALSLHHKYNGDGCLNWEPVGNNPLAEAAHVAKSSASAFFKKYFGGHRQYEASCRRNTQKVLWVLKSLNVDFTVDDTYYDSPPG